MSVAVKVLTSSSLESETTRQRFQQEAWVAGAVRSPWVVQVYDADVSAGMGIAWIAMEFVEGPTLHHVMKRFGPLPTRLVAPWLAGVLRGLVAIHSAGIVHRDLKPGNILLAWPPSDAIPQPRVVDFGIAKVVDAVSPPDAADDLTNTGATVCTPRYVAPEQLLKQPGPASDLYSLGIIGMMMLAGQAPYPESDGAVLMARHLAPDPVPVHPLVEASPLADVLRRAVEKSVDNRFQSALEMLDALEPVARQAASSPVASQLVSDLEALFPENARGHWALRRRAANSETLPTRTRSPFFDPVAAARADGVATGPLPALDAEPTVDSVSQPNRMTRVRPPPEALPTREAERALPQSEAASAPVEGTDELSASALVPVHLEHGAAPGPDPTDAEVSAARYVAHAASVPTPAARARRWLAVGLAAGAALALLIAIRTMGGSDTIERVEPGLSPAEHDVARASDSPPVEPQISVAPGLRDALRAARRHADHAVGSARASLAARVSRHVAENVRAKAATVADTAMPSERTPRLRGPAASRTAAPSHTTRTAPPPPPPRSEPSDDGAAAMAPEPETLPTPGESVPPARAEDANASWRLPGGLSRE